LTRPIHNEINDQPLSRSTHLLSLDPASEFLGYNLAAGDTRAIHLEYEDKHQEHSVLAVWHLFFLTRQLLNLGIDIQIRVLVEIGSTWMHGLSAAVDPERLKGRRDKINQI
jgi:hypothetical protein